MGFGVCFLFFFLVEKLAADAIVGYQRLAQRYVAPAQDPETLSSEEASIWIQTGLALTPFAFADTRYSVDWAIAWAMIGEWTNHQLFPPPKSGEWPRFAHVNGLEEGFRYRRPSLVTWARACFEQGALPALSVLPGAVEVRSMVGDKMFQASLHGFPPTLLSPFARMHSIKTLLVPIVQTSPRRVWRRFPPGVPTAVQPSCILDGRY